MIKKKRHTAKFKSTVALDAAKETKTLNELASQHGVYPAQISEWKKRLLEGAEGIFTTPQKKKRVERFQHGIMWWYMLRA